MHIYFSGIGGSGLSPLAQLSLDCGFEVSGSDTGNSLNTEEVEKRGVKVQIGQNRDYIKTLNESKKIDWFVYSAGIQEKHSERKFVKKWNEENPKNQIKESKRDELLNFIIKKKELKLVAISGTHGKTTTTGMMVWVLKQLEIPVSYSIGSNISFGPAAKYENGSEFFVYECDEFDRNFLKFNPHATIIPSLDYDHHDTYPTENDYREAFEEFIEKTEKKVVGWKKDLEALKIDGQKVKVYDQEKVDLSNIELIGIRNRENGFLVTEMVKKLIPEIDEKKLYQAISSFPGTQRRLEKLRGNLYTDYAHHPEEIYAVLNATSELSKDIIAVYQPHQNIRQHRLKNEYGNCFDLAKKVYWLPTYLSREDENLEVLEPGEIIEKIENKDKIEVSEMNKDLQQKIEKHIENNDLVILIGAGSIDSWGRENLA